ncbi:MAG: hypothetical protein ABSH22_10990 [Tepidisphaeraceae bacterium]
MRERKPTQLVREFIHRLDLTERWLAGYLEDTRQDADERALALSLKQYLHASRKYAAGIKVKVKELERRRLKIEKCALVLRVTWSQRGRP